ncbi:hypothetical protein DENSPDRAFT_934398 [Dentipellis sp. KUC8613]|nr:hypothetical protein DENSPDRAFT_934398 [Dentipellis sp. KUC8613]
MSRPVPLSARPVLLSARSVARSQPPHPVDVFAPHHALRAPSLALCVPHRAFSVARCPLPAPPRSLRLVSRPEALFASHAAPSLRLITPSHAPPHHLRAPLRRLDHPAVSLTRWDLALSSAPQMPLRTLLPPARPAAPPSASSTPPIAVTLSRSAATHHHSAGTRSVRPSRASPPSRVVAPLSRADASHTPRPVHAVPRRLNQFQILYIRKV